MKHEKVRPSGLSEWKNACAVLMFCTLAAIASPAQSVTTLVQFDQTNGTRPVGVLAQGPDGNFYGATYQGGAGDQGTVFKMTPAGALTTLHSFAGAYADGADPYAGVTLGTDGNYYGTTSGGGANFAGTVFKITSTGTETILHNFDYSDGDGPEGGVIQGSDGDFYGTTYVESGAGDLGTVFKMTPKGKLTTLCYFLINCSGGYDPAGGLIQGTDGNFYGTTSLGGYQNCDVGGPTCGTIFEITPEGTLTTLYSFCANNVNPCADGSFPAAGLVQGSDGNFYGTTELGGGGSTNCEFGCGTFFKMTPTGTLTTLYNFCSQSGCTDGVYPEAVLVQGSDGNFYGTTEKGGDTICKQQDATPGCGTIFKITPAGVLTTLYKFCQRTNCADGALPAAGLMQATNGNFYGTTSSGGLDDCYRDCGTVFRLSVGLGPFVKLVQPSGMVGGVEGILGQGFKGTTSVLFNGVSASFKIVSNTLITATIPAGATSGFVTVTTPSGTLTSNMAFQVSQ